MSEKKGLKKQIVKKLLDNMGWLLNEVESGYMADLMLDCLRPHDSVKDLEPVILYFQTREDRDEFIAAIMEAKPNLKAVTLEGQAE